MSERQDSSKTSLYNLINNLDLQIQVYLSATGIFTESDLDHIKSGVTQQEQRLKLLNILQSRNCKETDLKNALMYCNQIYLLDELQAGMSTLKRNQILHREIAKEVKDPHLELDELQISKLWEVPQRNPYFTGRNSLLEQVSGCFGSNDEQQLKPGTQQSSLKSHVTVISACHGIGGVGKTQLAIEFTHRYQAFYPYVFWIPAESSTQIDIAYQKIARDLHMDTEQKIDAIIREVKGWFDRHPGCLLVYDNASNVDDVKAYLPLTGCHIIVTSRNTEWNRLSNTFSITVDVFTVDEAREFFAKLLGNQLKVDDVDALSGHLGYLPLALAQAGAYIKNSNIVIAQYIELYKEQKEKLLADKSLPKFHHEPVLVSFDITMDDIQKKSMLAVQLLRVCAYLHNADIPDFILEVMKDTKEDNPNGEIYEEARGILDIYSMIKVNSEKATVSIHQILQEIIRLKEKQSSIILNKTREMTLKLFPEGKSMVDLKRIQSLTPHLEATLGHADEKLKKDDRKQQFMLLHLLEKLTEAYRAFGIYQNQRNMEERVLDIKQQRYGSDHPELGTTLNSLGEANRNLGEYSRARDHFERALKINEKHLDFNHPLIAITYNNLGILHISLGDYSIAKDYLERALQMEQKHYGPDHPGIARTLNNLGGLELNLREFSTAKDYLERALKITEMHYEFDHPELGTILNLLGEACRNLGEYSKTRDHLERALKIFEKHYNLDHPLIGTTLSNLGNAYRNLGDYRAARDNFERALKIYEKHYSPNHPLIGTILSNLGNIFADLGEYGIARDYSERALKIREEHFSPDHPMIARSLNNLGSAYVYLGDYSAAKDHFERVLKIDEKHYSPDHPEIGVILRNLGQVYIYLGEHSIAKDYFERNLKIYEKHYGPDHFEIGGALTELGKAYIGLGEYRTAQDYLERALQIEQNYYETDHPQIGMTLNNLGHTYLELGEYNTAKSFLERAQFIFKKSYGPDHEWVEIVQNHLKNVEEKQRMVTNTALEN